MVKNSLSILFMLFIVSVSISFSQVPRSKNLPTHDDKPLHFGFTVGFNTMDFRVENSPLNTRDSVRLFADIYTPKPGFHVSIVSNLRLNEYMDLRFLPGITFGERHLVFLDTSDKPIDDKPQQISSNFLDFPLILKFKGERINNFRPYVIAGSNFRVDLAKKDNFNKKEDLYIKLKKFDFYYELGVGFDSYLQYFKLSTELKYSIGVRNVLDDNIGQIDPNDPKLLYTKAIDKLLSRVLMLSFYFE